MPARAHAAAHAAITVARCPTNPQWRNNEDGACPNTWPWPGSPAAAASAAATSNRAHSKLTGSAGLGNGQLTATVLVWMYTWPAQQSLLTFSGVPAV